MGKVFANEPLDRNQRPVALTNIPRVPLLIILWSFFALTTVVMIFRLAIRLWLQRRLFWDDAFAIAGYFGQIAQMVMVTIVSPLIYIHLQGFSGARPPPEYGIKITKMIRLVYAHNVVFTASIYCIKASFMALFWRLIRDLSDYRKAWWAVAVLCAVSLTINAVLFPVGCSTLEAFHCIDKGSIDRTLVSLRFNTAMDIVTDVCIMVLPIVLIVRSNLPGPEKAGLVVLFALGFSIIAISVVRIIKSNGYQSQPPLSWLLFWSTMETAVAVITTRTSRRRRRTRTAQNMDNMNLTLPTISDLEASTDSQRTGNDSSIEQKEPSMMAISSDRKTTRSHDAELKEETMTGASIDRATGSIPGRLHRSDCDRQPQAPSMAQLR
ncbi:hypothetical protein TESG_03770 [Trichophyton tonsurans CBS 112818]|uniref:Rhodopsin domain-containing protein n=1 Tax=Trichophyton tonsurans (strain CBS 112818) TaxID=647933 RepID=F2RYB8_TRIT1|nr:hypothetical protein TESG_03770 [Trichophyton tonsurans CBS 112818]